VSVQIKVKLTGIFKSKTPEGGVLELPDGTSIESALAILDIPAGNAHVIMLNAAMERDLTRKLAPDDDLTVLAPVHGG
jgi:sulfur carrier protein ThiS